MGGKKEKIMIYLDHAATTPVSPEVAQTMVEALTKGYGNPSAQYALGREAKALTDGPGDPLPEPWGPGRSSCFSHPAALRATTGLSGPPLHQNRRVGKHIVTTAVEHSAVLQCVKQLEREGYTADYVKPDGEGRISAEAVLNAIREDTALVSVMLVNNETGAVSRWRRLLPD